MAGSSFPLSTVAQYAFLALIGYILAGAPLLNILSNSTPTSSPRSAARRGKGVPISPGKLENLVFPDKNLSCREHGYGGVHVLSREPLVVYIEGFLGSEEVEEVVGLR
jgi:prolyl 4-hydroxylase